jgi:hypothetical protein
MIAAFGTAKDHGAALALSKRGTKAVGPGFGFEIGGFVENDEIETAATERIGFEAAFDEDDGTVFEIDAEVSFERFARPERAGQFFKTVPDDFFGEFAGWADVPNELVGLFSSAHEFGECKFGFAEAAARNNDAKADGTVEDLILEGVETELGPGIFRLLRDGKVQVHK